MVATPPEGARRRVRAALLQQVCGGEDLAALGAAVARMVGMSSSDDQGTHALAAYVLADPVLSQRILRLFNTIYYRTAAGTPVTTIARAIALLGFDNVKATALAMLLVDALDSGEHASSVRVELEIALCASLVGREMARASSHPGAEEAAVCALFKNLGPLLVACRAQERYGEIAALGATGRHTPEQAAQMILGCSYEALSQAVLAQWQIPEAIVQAQAPLASQALAPAGERGEWMRQVAAFALDVARLMARSHEPAALPEAQALLLRYGEALELDREGLAALFQEVQDGMSALLQSMNMKPAPKAGPRAGALPNVLLLATLDSGEDALEGLYPSGKPKNARELLLAGVQEATRLRASGPGKVNEVILTVLETLQAALGCRFATVCLKDAKSGQYRARLSLGEQGARLQEGFAFPAAPARDLFHLAMENDADLVISDADSPRIRELLPAWHKALLPDARSFIVLPLVVGKAQLGLFYADRITTAPEGVAPDETSLIKALKGQVLAALAP